MPATNRVIVERDLPQALADGDLRLVFQPFMRLEDGEPIGAEVLLRWQHPTEVYIRPGEFLDVAEHSGLIVPIGEWNRDLLVSVNVSASRLADPGIVDAVRTALATSGLRPECLWLELTEQAPATSAAPQARMGTPPRSAPVDSIAPAAMPT